MIVFPNAKINIGLFVTGKRPDGFHNLETVFYPIGLSDILEIGRAAGGEGEWNFKSTGIDVGCESGNNLIVKAYKLLAAEYHLPAIQIHLHKVIPFGAGLGGGSADAAFMLKALNEYFELHLSCQQLMAWAAQLGSDCAFFVRNRPAFASGKGELLEEMDLELGNYRLVLLKPETGVSTAEAYSGISPQPAGFDLHQLPDIPIQEWKDKVSNDFEHTVFLKHPEIGLLKKQLYDAGAVYASMTGSGSAVYGFFERSADVKIECPGCFIWQDDRI